VKIPIPSIFSLALLATFPLSAQESNDAIPLEEWAVVIAKETEAQIPGNKDDEAYAGGPIEEAANQAADTSQDWANPGTNSK
jgi:hypothetical protein